MALSNLSRRSFVGAAAAAALGAGLVGCSSGSGSAASKSASASSASASASASSASASASSAAAAAAKPVILVTSFGTSYNDSREVTIGAVEKAIQAACPDYEVRRAFTAQIIIDKLKERDGLEIDNVEQALQRCIDDGVKTIIVQPTHLMDGFEYQDVSAALDEVASKFDKAVIGKPLIKEDADYEAVIAALTDWGKAYDDGNTAICFMGHGTEADSNVIYSTLQDKFKATEGADAYFVATVEATPTFDDVATAAKEAGYTKAVLRPLMVVAGDHANNDMADTEDPESFASVMKDAGFEVESVIEGLGQLPAIQDLYVKHIKETIATL